MSPGGGSYYFWLGASADAETGSRASTEPASGLRPTGIDPARFMEVVEKHAATVTLSFLCDIAPVLGLQLGVKIIERDQ